jgi:hypothetical protein
MRYQASVGGGRSLALKATRRLIVDSQLPAAGGVRIRGHLVGHRSARRAIVIARQLSCSSASNRHLRTIRTDARGRFSVVLPAPRPAEGMAVYRVRTADGGKTYTLPLLVRAAG